MCKVMSKKLLEQRMGDLPEVMTRVPCRPYTHVCLDFAGPVHCASMTNRRKQMKCWILIIVCMNTGHVDLRLTSGYSTEAFLRQFEAHCLDTTVPAFVYTDSGSQLVAAKKLFTGVDEDEQESPMVDWDKVRDQTSNKGIVWKLAPPGCQWRDGRSEAVVRSAKRTMKHFGDSNSFTFEEKQLLLAKSKRAINERPLGARFHNGVEPGYTPITPNLLVNGYYEDSKVEELTKDLETMGDMVDRIKFIQKQHAVWWELWFRDCWEQLMPLPKWKTVNRNLQPGDICLLAFQASFGPGKYKLCRVIKTFLDSRGLVRSAEILLRPTRSNEPPRTYKPTKMTTMIVGIQRLVLIVRNEDAAETTDPDLDVPTDEIPDDLTPKEKLEARVKSVSARVNVSHVEAWCPLLSESNHQINNDQDLSGHSAEAAAVASDVPDPMSRSIVALTSNSILAEVTGVDVSIPVVTLAPVLAVRDDVSHVSIGPNHLPGFDEGHGAVDLIPPEPDFQAEAVGLDDCGHAEKSLLGFSDFLGFESHD